MGHLNTSSKGRSFLIGGISFLLILLFVYTATSKLLDFPLFEKQMALQPFNASFTKFLIWFVPAIELITAVLLVFGKTNFLGLVIAFGLMTAFSVYIGLILLHFFGQQPCSCGGVIKALGWRWHFIFNLFFLLLTGIAIYNTNRERRRNG